ncbi:MAG: hypothetical protein HC933_23340 [Pleurocapsa sp. SU_196_0]|nr:hypothetical protein [Pleurocapsa sp. SU_196_0]
MSESVLALDGIDTFYGAIQALKDVTITVNALSLPEILSFTADNNPVTAGASTPLRWSVKNAANIKVDRITAPVSTLSNNNYTPNGSTVSNNVSSGVVSSPYTDYQLTATNAVGTVTRILRVFVGTAGAALPVPPTNVTFTANPATVYYPNNTSTLSWGATNANTAVINQGVGTVTPAGGGSKGVTVTATTTYTLTVSNTGGSVSRTATVTVVPPANPVVSVTAVNPTGTPASNQFYFAGGNATVSWNVTNKNAGANVSGAGTGPYNYVVEEQIGTGAWTQIYTGPNTSLTRALPANTTTADIARKYRVTATNTSTTLSGNNTSGTLTVLKPQVPQVNMAGNGPFNFPSGTASLTSSGVSNTAAAGAGPYTYTLRTESVSGSGNFNTVVYTGATPPNPYTQVLTNTGTTNLNKRYRLEAKNTTSNLSGYTGIITVKVNAPLAPDITSISANPTVITTKAGGTSLVTWVVSTNATRPITSIEDQRPRRQQCQHSSRTKPDDVLLHGSVDTPELQSERVHGHRNGSGRR